MKRPVGVTILALIAIVSGVVSLLVALPYLGITTFAALTAIVGEMSGLGTGIVLTAGIMLLLFGVLELTFGVAALQLRSWAWVLGVVVYSLNLLFSVVQLFTVGAMASVVIAALVSAGVIAYLYSHDVRTAFDHEDGSLFHTGHHTPMSAA